MVDRELLELAAKAAGIRGRFGQVLPDGKVIYESTYFADSLSALWACDEETIVWDPRNEDGDALRLAVAIGASIYADGLIVVDSDKHYVVDHFDDGIIESLRHAIVRVAAELGRNKEHGDGGGV